MNYGIEEDKAANDFSMLVRQISIDKLQEESKKIGPSVNSAAARPSANPKHATCQIFIKGLLNPKDWQNYDPQLENFTANYKKSWILDLIAEC